MSAPALSTAAAHSRTPADVGMSAGEIAVVAAFARGHSPAKTAQDLRISLKTVETRVRRMCARLGMPGAPHAVLVDYAYRYGHLTVDQPHREWKLPQRQAQCLELLAQGLGMRAVAAEFGISRQTARQHRYRLFASLGVNSPEQAVAVGWATGILQADADATVAAGRQNVLVRRTDSRATVAGEDR